MAVGPISDPRAQERLPGLPYVEYRPGATTPVGRDRPCPEELGTTRVFDVDTRALDCSTGGGQDLTVSADEVCRERPGEAIQGVVKLNRDADSLRRQEPASVVEGKADPCQAKHAIVHPTHAPCVVLMNILSEPSAGGAACCGGAVRRATPSPVKLTSIRGGPGCTPGGSPAGDHQRSQAYGP